MKLGRFILPFIVFAAAAGFIGFNSTRDARPVEAAGATLNLPDATCSAGSPTADVSFTWSPFVGDTQWLDISTTDTFAPGTFQGYGPMEMDVAEKIIEDLPAGTVHFFRINTEGPTGWDTSDVQSFVPCGGPALLWGPVSCEDKFRARVNFSWAPLAGNVIRQYIDVGYDPNFAPGTFAGRLHSPQTMTYEWRALQANLPTFFRVNALDSSGAWHSSATGSFTAECAPPAREGLFHSGDRLIVNSVGIDAPVNVRDVGMDGHMGDPEGPLDVVRYNFPLAEGFGGYPGDGGTTLIAGHLDFRNYGLAVFGQLDQILVGDVVDYLREDGTMVSYQVDWIADVEPDYHFGELARNTATDTLVLITCNGTFDWYGTEQYSHRRLVHATKLPAVAAAIQP